MVGTGAQPLKDEYGTNVTWLGVVYDFSTKNSLKLDISDRRKEKLLDSLREAIHTNRIEKENLHRLIGRLESAQQIQQGRVGRPYVFPLHTKLYAANYNTKLSQSLNQHFFQCSHIPADALTVITKIQNWVSNQLAWPVKSDIASPFNLVDRNIHVP